MASRVSSITSKNLEDGIYNLNVLSFTFQLTYGIENKIK